MRLIDFMKKLERDVVEFEKNYREGRDMDPNNYPLEMSEEDWYDQYITWIDDNA